MLLFSKRKTADEMLRAGLLNEVLPAGESFLPAVHERVREGLELSGDPSVRLKALRMFKGQRSAPFSRRSSWPTPPRLSVRLPSVCLAGWSDWLGSQAVVVLSGPSAAPSANRTIPAACLAMRIDWHRSSPVVSMA